MDGIALQSEAARGGARRFPIQATQAAGDPALTLGAKSSCLEVMTGAVLPLECDAVVPFEDISISGGVAELAAGIEVEAWQNIHRKGTDSRQGALLLTTGTRLSAPDVAIVASAGMARVRVSSQPMVVVISTGNELVEPGESILTHQVRRSNVYGVAAILQRQGFHRVAEDHVRDDTDELKHRLKLHLDTHDVVILSGGVSMGKFD